MLLERNNLEGIRKWYNVVIVFKLLNYNIMFRLHDSLSLIIFDIGSDIYKEAALICKNVVSVDYCDQ